MLNFLLVVQFLTLGLMLVSVMQMIRVHFLSKTLSGVIDHTHELRVKALNDKAPLTPLPYPNIDATYNNLKWYKPWQRPSTLIVYDKEI